MENSEWRLDWSLMRKQTSAWGVSLWNAPDVGGRLKGNVGEPVAPAGRAGSGSWAELVNR